GRGGRGRGRGWARGPGGAAGTRRSWRRVRPAPPSHEPEDGGADREGHDHADDAGDAAGEPLVVHALHAVVGEGAVAQQVVLGPVDEALVLGDALEPVGAARRVPAHDAGEHEGDGDGRHPEPVGAPPGHAATSSAPTSRGRGGPAPCTRSGRVPSTAPTASAVITPSPTPMSTWVPTMAANTLPRSTSAVPPTANSTTKAAAARGTEANAASPAASSTPRAPSGSTARSAR